MPFSISPRIFEISVPDQTVNFHIWGNVSGGHVDAVRASLRDLHLTDDLTFDLTDAMRPGGTVIHDFEWGSLSPRLKDTLFDFGLSMAWITAPSGTDPRGSLLTHAGMRKTLSVRSDPARTSCDLVDWPYGGKEWAQRLASALFELAPLLSVPQVMSNHHRIRMGARIAAAQNARCVEELEVAAGWQPPNLPLRPRKWKTRLRDLLL